MLCAPIVAKLIVEAASLWILTGIPVMKCTYEVNGAAFTERQVGARCEKTPDEIPLKILMVAKHNACSSNSPAVHAEQTKETP